jgi:hypothetical protein
MGKKRRFVSTTDEEIEQKKNLYCKNLLNIKGRRLLDPNTSDEAAILG